MADRVGKPEKRARLHVSLPAALARWVRERARRDGTSISAVVEVALRLMKDAGRG